MCLLASRGKFELSIQPQNHMWEDTGRGDLQLLCLRFLHGNCFISLSLHSKTGKPCQPFTSWMCGKLKLNVHSLLWTLSYAWLQHIIKLSLSLSLTQGMRRLSWSAEALASTLETEWQMQCRAFQQGVQARVHKQGMCLYVYFRFNLIEGATHDLRNHKRCHKRTL